MKLFIYILFIFTLLNLFYCTDDSGKATTDEKNSLYYAILIKNAECGNNPGVVPFITNKPSKVGTNICMLAILNAKCPFQIYPIECLEYFKIDVPNVGPKLPKTKI